MSCSSSCNRFVALLDLLLYLMSASVLRHWRLLAGLTEDQLAGSDAAAKFEAAMASVGDLVVIMAPKLISLSYSSYFQGSHLGRHTG